MTTDDQYDGQVRNYRGKFGRMLVNTSASYIYTATVPVDENQLATEALLFSGAAIRLGGTYCVDQLIIFEKSAPAVTTPKKAPGSLLLFTPANTGDLAATIATPFDIGSTMTWENYAGCINVMDTDYKEIKMGTTVIAVAQVNNINLNIQSYKTTRALMGVFVTEDGSGSKSFEEECELHFTLSIKQD